MGTRIPLDLYGEVTTASGARFKLDANQAAGSRPQNFSFRTKIGEGFSDASFQLARRIDRDYPDLNLVDTITFTGADGTVAYEGRNSAMPRDLSDRHSLNVTLVGWMAHAKDRRFQEIYVDRDAGAWGAMPLNEKARIAVAARDMGSITFNQDRGGLTALFPNQALGAEVWAATWYIAPPGCTVAKFGYRGKDTSLPGSWSAPQLVTATSDASAGTVVTTLTLDDTLRVATPTTAQRYAYLLVYSNGSAATPAAGASRVYSKVAVYGNHGVTLRTGETTEPDGVWASDAIVNIASRFCPQLDTSGVQATDYVIQHLAFRDRTMPYDAFLEVNKYHLWNLAVWENKRLVFEPYDLDDYDWEIRTDDPGTTFSPQGVTIDDLYNGTEVTYTNALTGAVDVLTPDDYEELRDESPTNPWNQHGVDHWDPITLSSPTSTASALNLGTAALADRNRPKTPGTITVRGYIRDRAGNDQPCWKPRAGQTIAITNFPNDAPRLIVETDYDDENKLVRLSIDKPFALIDAYLDRLSSALGAKGLG